MALTRREFFATAGLGAGTLALGNPTATAQPVALGHSTTVTEHDPIMNHIGRELSALQRRGMQSAAEHARVLGSQARLAAIRIRRLGLLTTPCAQKRSGGSRATGGRRRCTGSSMRRASRRWSGC